MVKSLRFTLIVIFLSFGKMIFSQVGIPTSTFGIGFGNSSKFTGLRFNYIDKNIDKINGINVTIWQPNHDSLVSGTINGLSIGLPMAYGSDYRNGINLALFGTGAVRNISGINIAGLGVGAGGDVAGINLGGLGIGAGRNLSGINFGGLGAGAGGDMKGINFGGLGVGAGNNMTGINIGGLGVGAGNNAKGINIGGFGSGAGNNMIGLNIGGLGVGAGTTLKGINIGGLGVGAGNELIGLNISGLAAGAPNVKGITVAPIVGGQEVSGITIAPIYFKVISDDERQAIMRGLSVSAYNRIQGDQRGVSIGILNVADHLSGFQFGLINIAKSNRKGLKVLPIFNGPFH